jgi:hypothetical protein
MAQEKSSKAAKKSSNKSKRKKINPDDVGVSKEEADQIIAELDDLTQEEVDKQAREADG